MSAKRLSISDRSICYSIVCIRENSFRSRSEQNPIEHVWLYAKEYIRKQWYRCEKTFQSITNLLRKYLTQPSLPFKNYVCISRIYKLFRNAISARVYRFSAAAAECAAGLEPGGAISPAQAGVDPGLTHLNLQDAHQFDAYSSHEVLLQDILHPNRLSGVLYARSMSIVLA